MKKRALITVTGTVQMAGFKSRVKIIALEFGLVGNAENLKKGAVRIIVEGESSKVEHFLVALRKEGKSIGIRGSRVRRSPFKGQFDKFTIIRDENFEEAMSDRMDLGISYMRDIKGDISGVNKNTSTIKREIHGVKKGIVTLDRSFKKGIGGLDRHTGQHFKGLNRKYGTFGHQMKGMAKDIKAMRELLAIFVEYSMKKETAEA